MINIISIVPIMVTGISGAIGLFVLILALSEGKNKVQIFFSLTALSVMVYGVGTIGLYNSTQLFNVNIWQRTQIIAIVLFCLFLFFFIINLFDNHFWKKHSWILTVLAVLILIPQLFINNASVWNIRKSNFHLINFFGSMQIVNECEPGILTQITYIIGFLTFIFILCLVIYECRYQPKKFRHPLFLSTIILFLAFANDSLIGLGVINSIYILEGAFLLVIGILAIMLTRNVITAVDVKEALEKANFSLQTHKEELEKTIFARTQDYLNQAEYFRKLVDNNPIATVTLDDNHKILSANPAFEELFGYSQAEAFEKDLDEIISPEEEFQKAKELTNKVVSNIHISSTGIRKRKDGRRVNVEILGVPVLINNKKTGVLGLYRDISHQVKAEKVLQESEMRYRSLFEDSPISLWEEDFRYIKKEIDKLKLLGIKNFKEYFADQKEIVQQLMKKVIIINVNQATIHLFGAQSKDDFFQGIGNIVSKESVITQGEIYAALAAGETQFIGEVKHIDFSGTTIYTVLRLAIAPGYEDTWEKVFISVIDITERKKNESYLEYLSTHDQLTGVANRSLMYDRLNHAIEIAKRNRKMVAVFFLDLDGFKNINDQFGHLIGDKLLVQIAKRLEKNLRSADTVARFGGDEFILILENITDIASIKSKTERILRMISEPYQINGNICQVTTSIGTSFYPLDGETAGELIDKADTAMYLSKQSGKNQFKFFNPNP